VWCVPRLLVSAPARTMNVTRLAPQLGTSPAYSTRPPVNNLHSTWHAAGTIGNAAYEGVRARVAAVRASSAPSKQRALQGRHTSSGDSIASLAGAANSSNASSADEAYGRSTSMSAAVGGGAGGSSHSRAHPPTATA
jgi:hypothetical protein